ncbi:MAG: hypothetical protein NVSMB64_13130 [Candidatus Velthaea sp.]
MDSRAPRLLALIVLLAAPAVAARAETTLGSLAIPSIAAAPPLDPKAPAAAWDGIPAVALTWDVQHQRPASEASTARIATDGKDFFVRFDVAQRETLLQQQHTNNVGDGTDDEVWVDFWPGGNSGFFYQFAATSNGTHFQYSGENTAYAPTWEPAGAVVEGGFVTTMRIPINVMRVPSNTWKMQFVRIIRSTGERQIWSYAPAQTNGDDVTYAGVLSGITATSGRPQPRIGLYGLGQAGSALRGLSTSRAGADFSLPVTPQASFYGTIHPDFSNVEVDQATISPTACARSFNEVRPFFPQGANFCENFACNACPLLAQLYTPAIPTPRDGYAFEGRRGGVTLAAFDAVGVGRIDTAASFAYLTPDNHLRVTAQRVAADCSLPGTGNCPYGTSFVHDDTATTGISYNDGKHVDAYFDYGSESGSNVALGNQAQRYDGGFFAYTNTSGIAASARKVGYYYNPADGLVQHPDIAGYAAYAVKLWLFSEHSKLNSAGASVFLDRYHNAAGALDQTDTSLTFDVLTRSRIDVQGSVGSSYVLESNCLDSAGNAIAVTPDVQRRYAGCQIFTPVSQNGLGITYHSGTANAPGNFPNHAGSSTPTSVTLNTGRFGPGRLDAWQRSSTLRAGVRGTILLEADNTRQYLDTGRTNVQWLERAGYTYAVDANTSFSLGLRRIIGTPPVVFAAAPVSCTTVVTFAPPGTTAPCTGAWNVSFAYHRRMPHAELYFAYGDASRLSTYPAFVLKFIRYVGAEKGT